jgi:hypothetical protein
MGKKQFYSIEEASAKLSKTADELKALVRDGTLREFRDAGKVFFKSEDVEKLAAKALPPASDDTGDILLEAVGDEGGGSGGSTNVPALIESSGGTSIIGLEPIGDEDESGGTKSGSRAGSRGPGKKKGDTVITASGIGVFDQDELEIDADPMAKTQITSGAVEDQISLEGAGSGSGLLDLAREADDTALGADLLDEIYPGEEVAAAPAAQKTATPSRAPAEDTATEAEAAIEEPPGEAIAPVVIASAGDPGEGMMTGLLVAAMLLLALGATVTGGLVQGFMPDFARLLSSGMNFWIFLGSAAGLAGIGVLAGWFVSRSFGGGRRR